MNDMGLSMAAITGGFATLGYVRVATDQPVRLPNRFSHISSSGWMGHGSQMIG